MEGKLHYVMGDMLRRMGFLKRKDADTSGFVKETTIPYRDRSSLK